MDADLIFKVTNAIALVAWLLLFIVPNAKITGLLVRSGLAILVLAAVYALLIFSFFKFDNMQDFNSLDGVMHLFSNPMGVVAGWTHYLAFDLLAGLWLTTDGEKHGINRWWLLPCQLLTFMFGPIGLLCYWLVRFAITKSFSRKFMH